MTKTIKIPASLIRGGTSKGVFFDENALPPAGEERDALLLTIMGSPDPTGMQLNGMGCGISSTSKVALISPSSRPNIDVNYLFGQVEIKEAHIDWLGSCGNLVTGVGLYAIHHGLVKTQQDGSAKIRIWQANLGHEIRLDISSPKDKKNLITIPGVPGKGARIYVEFISPSPSLIPQGKPIHMLSLPNGKKMEATLILGANPTVFVRAKDLGLSGKEIPSEIDFKKFEPLFNHLGSEGAKIMQIPFTSALKIAWVSSPVDYMTSDGIAISESDVDILSRISTDDRVHHAYTGTGAVNLACATKIPGSIPFEMIPSPGQNTNSPVRIGHPKGVMEVNANVVFDEATKKWTALSSGYTRTAKILMVGEVY